MATPGSPTVSVASLMAEIEALKQAAYVSPGAMFKGFKGQGKGDGKGKAKGKGKGWGAQGNQNQNWNWNENMNGNVNQRSMNQNTPGWMGNWREPRVLSEEVVWTCVECFMPHHDKQCTICRNRECRLPRTIASNPSSVTFGDIFARTATATKGKGKTKAGGNKGKGKGKQDPLDNKGLLKAAQYVTGVNVFAPLQEERPQEPFHVFDYDEHGEPIYTDWNDVEGAFDMTTNDAKTEDYENEAPADSETVQNMKNYVQYLQESGNEHMVPNMLQQIELQKKREAEPAPTAADNRMKITEDHADLATRLANLTKQRTYQAGELDRKLAIYEKKSQLVSFNAKEQEKRLNEEYEEKLKLTFEKRDRDIKEINLRRDALIKEHDQRLLEFKNKENILNTALDNLMDKSKTPHGKIVGTSDEHGNTDMNMNQNGHNTSQPQQQQQHQKTYGPFGSTTDISDAIAQCCQNPQMIIEKARASGIPDEQANGLMTLLALLAPPPVTSNTVTAKEQGTTGLTSTGGASASGEAQTRNMDEKNLENRTGTEEKENLGYQSMSDDEETTKEKLALNNPDTPKEHKEKIATKHAEKNAKKKAAKAVAKSVAKVENPKFKK